ncbi:MAG: amidophosphoribosyltransferase [Lentisphaerae bacterium]|nr:amidophosphoribosyltransferase [Lentisphaerota bacterium]
MLAASASDDSTAPRESCGLMAVFDVERAADVIHDGLFAQQHRGQEGAGMVVSDGQRLQLHKGPGLVQEVFPGDRLVDLPGRLGIGHVRYSTCGGDRAQNIQPLLAECADGPWAIAHNGNLTNAAQLRRAYQQSGSIFHTTTDSEVLVHLLADPYYRSRIHRVGRALAELQGAFAFVLLTPDSILAARDPHGFKPLVLGTLGQGFVVASESCAFRPIGARYLRDIEPGELVTINRDGLASYQFAEPAAHGAQCVFELVYFARPDSLVFGHNVHQVRVRYGMRLAQEHPVEADVVIPIPDSGMSAAIGYSRASGIPLDMGFIRNHYIGRTFIMPEAGKRATGADRKLSVLPETVAGRRVVVVDDSIVRGNTARKRIALLRECGATEVHVRISCPPTRHPCFYGIDFATSEELLAAGRGVEEIRGSIGADSLGYLSEEGLLEPFGAGGPRFCRACFNGDYPVPVTDGRGKLALESGLTCESSARAAATRKGAS